MPTRLEVFMNGKGDGATDVERNGRKVMENGKPFTHWSFDNRQKWFISEDDYDEFLTLYCAELRHGNPQYLTEKSTPIGQLRVDLDFKYDGKVEEHKHTQEQVINFVKAYMEEVKKFVEVPETVEIIVLEKDYPTYNKGDNVSKSGIHLQVPAIKTRPSVEDKVRRSLVKRMEEFFPDLGLKPKKGEEKVDWYDIYDPQPLTHTNNWPLLGSKKTETNSLPYEIKYMLNWDSKTAEVQVNENVPEKITPELLKKMSVRSKATEETKLTPYGEENTRPPAEPVTRSVSRGRTAERGDVPGSRGSSPGHVYIEPLSETKKEYIRKHVMNLSEQRYNGHHNDWYAVCQCLKNIHPDLESVFLDFIEQTSDDKRKSKAQATWDGCQLRVEGEIRYGVESLRKWSRMDNFDRYLEIEKSNVDSLVEEAASSGAEYDVAQVIYARYRDEFKCANLKQNEWFRYDRHIWKSSESGVDLLLRLSSAIARLFLDKEEEQMTIIRNEGECPHKKEADPTCAVCRAEGEKKKFSAIRLKMKKTGFKKSVMEECRALFYDRDFAQKVDENKHLIAFNNGVFDTLTREFRPGMPEDYISFCTNVDYALDTEYHQFACWNELKKFLHSILPNTNVREYFLRHLATCLSGVFNQRFHILTGSGSNGKSMLMNLCATSFGDYCYKANIAMFTQKRGKAGAANPELVRMKGKRFVMMSEPDEGEPLSSGFMKELTSSEKVSGRDLFQGSKQMVEFDVQAKIHLACNDKPKVNTTDGGTWRRLKVIDFPNKFVHEPKAPNELPIDESIMQKVLSREWAECFMAYLVHLFKEGKGLAKLVPPQEVEAYTNEYKEESDSIAKFMGEYIHAHDDSEMPGQAYENVSWTSIMTTFHEWKRSNEVTKGGVADLRKRIESEYGKMPTGGWTNFRFGTV